MRSEYILEEELKHILASLMTPNRLCLLVSLKTGLRVDDVLHLESAKLSERMTVTERKTGKRRRVYIGRDLYEQLAVIAGRKWVFEGRTDWKKPRSRQAVWKDIKRSAELFRVKVNLTPHSCRKVFAVRAFSEYGELSKVQELLNHSNPEITMIYALADTLVKRRKRKHSKSCH